MKSPSVNPTPEPQGQQGAFPLAAGSLPVETVRKIIQKWQSESIRLNGLANHALQQRDYRTAGDYRAKAMDYDACADHLRAVMEDEIMRQPKENTGYEPRDCGEKLKP